MCVTLKRLGCVQAVDMITPASVPFRPPVQVISSFKTVLLKSAPHR